jgi:opacity protein-like surface antigen
MTFHAGLSVPARSRLFADVALQYQYVGSMTAGPFTTADTAATMPRTRTSFNHHTIKLGLGVRI